MINPKLGADPAFAHLAGVGVAHQVVRALVMARGKPAGLRNDDLLELVALGTVADMAELTGGEPHPGHPGPGLPEQDAPPRPAGPAESGPAL